MTQSHEDALKDYHQLYSNDAFQSVEVAVVADICAGQEALACTLIVPDEDGRTLDPNLTPGDGCDVR